MGIIINAGSENSGGTFEQALANAKEWLGGINKNYPEVVMSNEEKKHGRDWNFTFTHKITKVTAELEIHGYTTEECETFRFHPRVYWNGSSTADPKIEDWLTDDYTYQVAYITKDYSKFGMKDHLIRMDIACQISRVYGHIPTVGEVNIEELVTKIDKYYKSDGQILDIIREHEGLSKRRMRTKLSRFIDIAI